MPAAGWSVRTSDSDTTRSRSRREGRSSSRRRSQKAPSRGAPRAGEGSSPAAAPRAGQRRTLPGLSARATRCRTTRSQSRRPGMGVPDRRPDAIPRAHGVSCRALSVGPRDASGVAAAVTSAAPATPPAPISSTRREIPSPPASIISAQGDAHVASLVDGQPEVGVAEVRRFCHSFGSSRTWSPRTRPPPPGCGR